MNKNFDMPRYCLFYVKPKIFLIFIVKVLKISFVFQKLSVDFALIAIISGYIKYTIQCFFVHMIYFLHKFPIKHLNNDFI